MVDPITKEEHFVKIPLGPLDALRTEIGQRISPETAEITWDYRYVIDPYGDLPDLPQSLQCIGRVYFAKAPDSEFWICFYDIVFAKPPPRTRKNPLRLAPARRAAHRDGQVPEADRA